MSDPVNHPAHYTGHPSGVEAIEITRWLRGPYSNAFKYVFRGWDGLKGDPVQDLKKALWYLKDAEKFPDDGRKIPRDCIILFDNFITHEPCRQKSDCLDYILSASAYEKKYVNTGFFVEAAKKLIQDRIASLQS